MKNNSLQKFPARIIFALALSTASLAAQQFIPPQNPITASQRLVLASGTTSEHEALRSGDGILRWNKLLRRQRGCR